ncbi:chromatin associated protein KTI12 [Dipodascopsis uninucleata]
MPVILVTGYPSSGKTTRTKEIIRKFKERQPNKNIVLVSDESLSIQKDVYRDAKTEKMARASIMSALKRDLSTDNIVIIDSLNYIKGFRYQIFCEAKAEKTTYCVVHVGTPVEVCKEWNSGSSNSWPSDLFDALIFRYEEPNGMNRWDSPLYTIPYTDESVSTNIFDQLYDSVMHGKIKPPNFATILKPAVSTDYVYELDRQTQQIVSKLVEAQLNGVLSNQEINVDSNLSINMPFEQVTSAQLQRLRRNFVSLNRVRQIETNRISPAFVEFLNRNFAKD